MAVIIKRQDGGISVMRLMIPAPPTVFDEEAQSEREMTPAEVADWRGEFIGRCVAGWAEVNPGAYLSHREMPEDAIPSDRRLRDAWRDETPEPVIDIDADAARLALVSDYVIALEAHYDAKAKERRYDNRLTCALRAGYPGPFQAEGAAFAIWMDTCNALAYQIMGEVLAGERPQPTVEALIAELPALEWSA